MSNSLYPSRLAHGATGVAAGGDLSGRAPLFVVVLGICATDIGSLGICLAQFPADCRWAFVVVLNAVAGEAPDLVMRLQLCTPMPVHELQQGANLLAGEVLVVPRGQFATMAGGSVRLHPMAPGDGQSVIDGLFSSLAHARGPRLAAVLFAGAGPQGTAGLRAVHVQGGITALETDSAESGAAASGSQIDPSYAHRVSAFADVRTPAALLPVRLRELLAARVALLRAAGPRDDGHSGPPDAAFVDVLQQLRAHAGQGFERYKPSTVRRRVARRMGLHGIEDLATYAALLRDSVAERDLLFKEMLIGVTGFFRDPQLWSALTQRWLPGLAGRPGLAPSVRAWCAGCSTGEEAYSLAMAWLDAAPSFAEPRRLQVFASDLSADAVALARTGSYPVDRLDGVSDERRRRYFQIDGGHASVVREVREMVMVAQHDMTADPPFSRLDLLVCRNVLIYLDAAQQKALIRLFHYCLRPGGLLVLGQTETVGSDASFFEVVDRDLHVYSRREGPPAGRLPLPLLLTPALLRNMDTPQTPMPEPRAAGLAQRAERLVLERFAPASVLVNAEGDILWTCGPVDRWLEPAAGRTSLNVLATAHPSLRLWLATALREAQASGARGVELRGLRLGDGPATAVVDVLVQPLQSDDELQGLNLIVLREGALPAVSDAAVTAGTAGSVDEALQRAQSELRSLREALRVARNELQARTEDHQSANEELQSSNEELTTSREEMQSMNEELQTINAELQAKLDALALEQSDMKNLLDSTQIATLFLDEALNVRRFTEQARQVINLRDGDAGRPLSDLTTPLQYPELVERAAEVLRTLVPSEREVPSSGGRWFAVRILPYRTVNNFIAGVVITFTDTTNSDASQRARLNGNTP